MFKRSKNVYVNMSNVVQTGPKMLTNGPKYPTMWLNNIAHFKGLAMRNLQYEKKIDKKCIIQAQMTKYIYYLFKWGRRYVQSLQTVPKMS